MNRRHLLAGIGTVAIGSPGCTELIAEGGSEDDSTNDQGQTDQHDSSDATSDSSAEKNEIVDLHQDGISTYNDAVSERSTGVDAWNDDDLSLAKVAFERAEEHYLDSRKLFRRGCVAGD